MSNAETRSDEPLLTVEDVRRMLNTSAWTVYELAKTGELPNIRLGRRRGIRFRRSDVEQWKRDRTRTAAANE